MAIAISSAPAAPFGWEADGRVQVTVGNDFERLLSASGDLNGNLFDQLEQTVGSASARAAYSVSTQGYRLRAMADVAASGSVRTDDDTYVGASAYSRVNLHWYDEITIGDQTTTLPLDTIVLKWRVSGFFVGSASGADRFSGSGGSVLFDVPTSNDPVAEAHYSIISTDGETTTEGKPNVSTVVSFSQLLNASGPTPVEADFELVATTNGGQMLAMFGNTAELISITFADGSTPESHGLSVHFASGEASPNSVPEPAASLWLGMVGVWAGQWRRKRDGVPSRFVGCLH